MNRTRLLIGSAIGIVLLAALVGWYLISPLCITRAVNEGVGLPWPYHAAAIRQRGHEQDQRGDDGKVVRAGDGQHEEAMMVSPSDAAMAAAKLLVRGQFHRVTHKGSGMTSIFSSPTLVRGQPCL